MSIPRGALPVLGICAILIARPAAGQGPHRRGLWTELGVGPGVSRVGCGGCHAVTVANGATVDLRLGGSLSDGVLFGVEGFAFTDHSFGFTARDTAVTAGNFTLDAVALWYPWRVGVFVKGGAGLAWGRFTVRPDTGRAAVNEGLGVGVSFGFGFDVPVSRRFALTANLATFITAIGDLRVNGTPADDVLPTMYQVGIGLALR